MRNAEMMIDGEWTRANDGKTFTVANPANGEVFAEVPSATEEDAERAIGSAREALDGWAALGPFARGSFLRKASAIALERKETIARIMTEEQGKPLKEAVGEIEKGAAILRYYSEEGERVFGKIIANEEPGVESRVVYQPIGVAGAISPWNYPIELLAWKIGGALGAGCTMVAKLPSETPLSPLAFVRCLHDAGIPAGVLNAITGPGTRLGPVLFRSPIVRKIAFTGSSATGRLVLAACVDSLKKVSLELGGSLPMVICADCDLDAAVAGAVRRSFRNMGQICIAINRIYVDANIYEEFIRRFVAETRKLVIGDGLTKQCDLGPMCTASGLSTTKRHISDAIEKGAKIACGGKRPEGKEFEKGYFFEPTILRDVNHGMIVMNEETFGPVVGVMPFSSVEEAIALANDTIYGLAAIVFTRSLELAQRLAISIDAGNVAINNVDAGVINAPYGGWKDSGFGHEHGPEGLREYLHTKHIRMRYA
ncbi:MAG: NAD-dependent succinate-semialdehyde dehydrogenase [Treponemataceae bacterium]